MDKLTESEYLKTLTDDQLDQYIKRRDELEDAIKSVKEPVPGKEPLEPERSGTMKASVRVMRSYDYCHFEICLSSDDDMALDDVNELRKKAALLVDEAVRQYQLAKKAEERRARFEWEINRALANVERIKQKPNTEWTIEEAALMRSFEDNEFWKSIDEEGYMYGDDPERDHHFSMLRRFQDSRISAGRPE